MQDSPAGQVIFKCLARVLAPKVAVQGRRKIISTPTGNEFVTFEIREIAPIAVAKKYAGIGSYGSNQKYENAV